ncbi:MAG: peptidase caspase catalytic subunit p20, partial [Myxococcaceae bacterium]|nr:peptidase caspase catalytic subunit p20 [Myxococcaceae bacterium]
MRVLGVLVWLLAALAAAAPVRRMAVVVGANAAPAGRQPLRFSHRDALSIAETLQQVGAFKPGDVQVLLDPSPAAVLEVLDARLATLKAEPGETLLLFYYSGHADDAALYPGGEALAFAALRARLERSDATVRLGILDACRGGAWTRTKGLTPSAPFPVETPLRLASEGSVLVASSSGLEDAHETDSLQSSFFTHHLVAALRGAAERNAEGDITLQAAFAYARDRTVHDTAIHTRTAQHPSFDIHLRGRQDLVLAQLTPGQSLVQLAMTQGPLQLIQLSSGLTVLDLPQGERAVKLAVAPGRYALKRVSADGTFAREFNVESGRTTEISEASLTLIGAQALARKSIDPPATSAHQLQVGIGTLPFDRWSTGLTFQLGYAYRFTPRFAWEVLRGFYNQSFYTGLRKSLEVDFGVLPVAFLELPRVVIETRAVFSVLRPTAVGDSGLQL